MRFRRRSSGAGPCGSERRHCLQRRQRRWRRVGRRAAVGRGRRLRDAENEFASRDKLSRVLRATPTLRNHVQCCGHVDWHTVGCAHGLGFRVPTRTAAYTSACARKQRRECASTVQQHHTPRQHRVSLACWHPQGRQPAPRRAPRAQPTVAALCLNDAASGHATAVNPKP